MSFIAIAIHVKLNIEEHTDKEQPTATAAKREKANQSFSNCVSFYNGDSSTNIFFLSPSLAVVVADEKHCFCVYNVYMQSS